MLFYLTFSTKKLFLQKLNILKMYWTLELASFLSDAPWPATKDELIDYSIRTGAPLEVVENLQAIEDEGDSTTLYKKSGLTIHQMKIIFGMKMNIKTQKLFRKVSFEAFFLIISQKITTNCIFDCPELKIIKISKHNEFTEFGTKSIRWR